MNSYRLVQKAPGIIKFLLHDCSTSGQAQEIHFSRSAFENLRTLCCCVRSIACPQICERFVKYFTMLCGGCDRLTPVSEQFESSTQQEIVFQLLW
jgi:hypothetical protein